MTFHQIWLGNPSKKDMRTTNVWKNLRRGPCCIQYWLQGPKILGGRVLSERGGSRYEIIGLADLKVRLPSARYSPFPSNTFSPHPS